MDKAQNLINRSSCLNKAETGEPLFILRANDPIAAQTVRMWAAMAEVTPQHSEEKIASALRLADDMEKWRDSRPQPVGPNDIVMSPHTMVEQRRR
jgi:hypothetical protein